VVAAPSAGGATAVAVWTPPGARSTLARMSRIVAHIDLDAFFATVEELERPELAALPLVVGGDPHGRGVVATANYRARRYGIASAMACAEALRRCPQAVFVAPRMSIYRQYSREVWSIVREIVPTIEQAGIDEGYLELGEVASSFDEARAVAEALRAVVRARTRLSCSLGVASSKVVAKIASDRRKPGGLTVVRPGSERRFLAPLAVRLLPGVGPRAEARLGVAGVETIGDLAGLEDSDLARVLPGKVGRIVRDRARGIDPRPLEVSVERISISSEETFARDVADLDRLHGELLRMAEGLARHLRDRKQTARTVTTKLRYPDFAIRTRSSSLEVGIDDAGRIGTLACGLLDRALRDRPGPLRLVGVGVSGLADHAQLELAL
jgi:DNA polymerase-4